MARVREHNEHDCNNFYQEPGWEEGGWCLTCGFDVPAEKPTHDEAAPGTWVGLTYVCACKGCHECAGESYGCVCDVDWEKAYGHDKR